jgi:hypothetical protein
MAPAVAKAHPPRYDEGWVRKERMP